MRNDLSEQSRSDLRRTLGEMESLAPVAPELETSSLDQRARRTRPQPLVVALGAALVVFVLALPLLLLTRTPDVVGTPESLPSPTQAATSTPDPVPTTATVDNGWTITEVSYLGTVLQAMDRGFVASWRDHVGVSDDGVVWQTSEDFADIYLYDIEWREGTLVAAGGGYVDEETGQRPESGVWVSMDHGATWTRGDIGGVADITHTPDGFVAVGAERDDSDPDYNKTHGVMWTSPDGLIWTRVATSDDPEGVSSSFRNVVWDDGIVILGSRGPHYVSEGSGLEDSEPHDNVTWFSDGTGLSEPASSDLVGNLDADQSAATPHGIVAMTHWWTPTVKTVAAAWISDDGTDWEELDIESGNYEYTDIAQIGDEVFLTGYELEGHDTGVWSSVDGTHWDRVDLPDLPEWARLQQVEASESALVVAGDTSSTGIIAGRQRG